MVEYDKLTTGFALIQPEDLGWQCIGRGAYLFSELVSIYGQEVFERHNWMPPNFREVTEKEMAVAVDYLVYPLIATAYRTLNADSDGLALGDPITGHMFINARGNGHMIAFDFKRTAKFYLFHFCEHDWKVILQNKNRTRKQCTKCNYLFDNY